MVRTITPPTACAFNVFVTGLLPSRLDTGERRPAKLGVVLIDALFNCKPVIASNVGGIADVIKDGETGLLVPEKDPQALALAVLRVLNDPVESARLGMQGSAYASRFFDWERITDDIERLYLAAIELSPEHGKNRAAIPSVRGLKST